MFITQLNQEWQGEIQSDFFLNKGILFLEEQHSFFFNLNVFICYFPNILVKKYFLQIYVQNPCQGT